MCTGNIFVVNVYALHRSLEHISIWDESWYYVINKELKLRLWDTVVQHTWKHKDLFQKEIYLENVNTRQSISEGTWNTHKTIPFTYKKDIKWEAIKHDIRTLQIQWFM